MKMVCFCEKVHFRFFIPPSSLKKPLYENYKNENYFVPLPTNRLPNDPTL